MLFSALLTLIWIRLCVCSLDLCSLFSLLISSLLPSYESGHIIRITLIREGCILVQMKYRQNAGVNKPFIPIAH